MHMLADSVEVARRRRHPQAQSHRGDAAALGPPDPGADRRGRRPPPGHPGAGASLATRPAHPNRGRPDRGRHRAVRLVPPWPLPLRRGVRHAGRGRPHPRLLWPDRPGSTQPLWDRQLNQALYTVELLATVTLLCQGPWGCGCRSCRPAPAARPAMFAYGPMRRIPPPVGAAITAGFRWAGVGWGGPRGPAGPAWPARPATAGWRQRPRGRPGPARRCRAGWAGRGREEPS
jgi:hypothetical protein